MSTKPDPRITKRRVTMTTWVTEAPAVEGDPVVVHERKAVDYVRPDFLDAYVADAKTRWQSVTVSEEPDAGPAGYDGDTVIPEQLIGKTVDDFARYGTPATPENALDDLLASKEN